jgi:hypothetical protein
MQASSLDEIGASLILRSEEGVNLCYVVEIEEKGKTHKGLTSENYVEALVFAQRIFDKMRSFQDQIGNIAVMIEDHHGRGISYSVNEFTHNPSFVDTDDFYNDLVNEFESAKIKKNQSNNVLFRSLIEKYKLNEYQEQKFLKFIKKSL